MSMEVIKRHLPAKRHFKHTYTLHSLWEVIVGGKMTNNRVKRFCYLALFIAVELVMCMVPFLGFIPLGAINATTLHIPVILTGIILGKKEGAIVGFIFGFVSMITNTTNPNATSFVFSPFIEIGGISGSWQSLIIAFIPRMMIGYGSGAIYSLLQKTKINESINVIISAICGSLINTILVMGGIYIFFGNAYASVKGLSYSALITFIGTVISTSGVAEALVAAVLCSAIARASKKIIRL